MSDENKQTDEQAIRAAHDAFNEAARKGDAATLDSLLHSGLIYEHSNCMVETKAQCISALAASTPDFIVEPGSTVQVYGRAAVWHGRITVHIVQKGAMNIIPLDILQVWVHQDGAWRMAARHASRQPSQ